MKYTSLLKAVAMRGGRGEFDLAGGRIERGGGVLLPRPRGSVLVASTGKVVGGPHDGKVLVVATEDTPVSGTYGGGDQGMSVYSGYRDDDESYQDALRLIVNTAVRDGSYEAIAGWGGDAVILLPGLFGGGYIIRVASALGDPEQSALYTVSEVTPEERADLGEVFAEAIDELIADLSQRAEGLSSAGLEDDAALLTELAVPWLNKEAAQRRAASARQYFLAAAHPSGGLVGPNAIITMSDLARNLYTDRANLTRTINQALAEETI